MPELPDITVYIDALSERITGTELRSVTLNNPFLLRTVAPETDQFTGRKVVSIQRVGKRIAIEFSSQYWLVLHLMIAGRLHWTDHNKKPSARKAIARFDFTRGTLLLTEAGSKRRAALHLFDSTESLRSIDKGGVEVLNTTLEEFSQRLTLRNHTLKRALTDQGLFSGIGNAYSDEILHHARMSPVALTQKLTPEQIENLFTSTTQIITRWLKQLRDERGDNFPEKVTAFRPGMAVHGRYREPCPVCDTEIQRIRYTSNETNYCPRCQTDGKLLADRSLSRLLKKDWPKTIEALENSSTTGHES